MTVDLEGGSKAGGCWARLRVNSNCLLWPSCLTACESPLGLHFMARDSVLGIFLVMLPLLIKLMPALAQFWVGMHFCFYKSVAFFWVLWAFLLILPLLIPSFPTLVIKLKFSFDDWINTPELSSLALVDPLSSKKVAGLLVETAVLQLLYSFNFLRITGGCFLFLWLKLCKFFWLKIPEWLRLPKECLPNYKYRHCFLESVALFIHSLSHKVKQLIVHIFVGITKHFQDFFCKEFL